MRSEDIFKRLAISETGFVFDPQTGYSYVVNETGIEILDCLKNNMDEPNIMKHIMKNYEVIEDQARRDYDSFILRLKQYGLYER